MATTTSKRPLRLGGTQRACVRRRAVGALVLILLVLLLTACPGFTPDRLEFDSDSRILRGSILGTIDTREAPSQMAFAGDASLLAVSWGDKLDIWDLQTLDLVTTIDPGPAETPGLSALSVDHAGSLVAGIIGGDVRLWSAHDGTLLRSLDSGSKLGTCQYCGIYSLSLNPAGGLLAASGGAPRVLIFDVASGEIVKELTTSGENTGLVSFSADGSLLAAASTISDTRYEWHVWDTATYQLVFEYEGTVDASRYPRFAVSADGQRLVVGSATKVELFDLSGDVSVLPLEEDVGPWFWAVNPDGTEVVIEVPGGFYSDLVVIDVASGATLATFENYLMGAPLWSQEGSYLVANAQLTNATDFEELHDFAAGALHQLQLEAVPEYVDSRSYTVSGTLSIDGGPLLDFSGFVEGNDTQVYLEPQMAPPRLATLDIEVHDHPWRLEARQPYSQITWPPAEPDSWSGTAVDRTVGPDERVYYPLKLWPAP